MECLFCGKKTQVTNSRKSGQNKVWRRRQCQACKKSFTTQETPMLENFMLISSGNNKKPTPYNRATLEISLLRACDHLINKQRLHIQSLVNTVENSLVGVQSDNNIVDINVLTQLTTNIIKRLDKIAYLKYCANHNIIPDKNVINTI